MRWKRYRQPRLLKNQGILGAPCADGCIWSAYAVNIGAQWASHVCESVGLCLRCQGGCISSCVPKDELVYEDAVDSIADEFGEQECPSAGASATAVAAVAIGQRQPLRWGSIRRRQPAMAYRAHASNSGMNRDSAPPIAMRPTPNLNTPSMMKQKMGFSKTKKRRLRNQQKPAQHKVTQPLQPSDRCPNCQSCRTNCDCKKHHWSLLCSRGRCHRNRNGSVPVWI